MDVKINNLENSSIVKTSEHTSSGFSMSAISSVKSIENKYDVCRDKDCMKKFCECIRQRPMEIINIRKIKLLIKEQQKLYENAEILLYF